MLSESYFSELFCLWKNKLERNLIIQTKFESREKVVEFSRNSLILLRMLRFSLKLLFYYYIFHRSLWFIPRRAFLWTIWIYGSYLQTFSYWKKSSLENWNVYIWPLLFSFIWAYSLLYMAALHNNRGCFPWVTGHRFSSEHGQTKGSRPLRFDEKEKSHDREILSTAAPRLS